MEECCGNSIANVLLSESNYEAWSIQVKYYLLARDLWDVVAKSKGAWRLKGDDQKSKRKAWKQKNAAALHAILISCSPSILPEIKDIKSARITWATLAYKYGRPKSEPEHDSESVAEMHETDNIWLNYRPLFKAIYRGDWNMAKLFLDQHPEGVRVRNPGSGTTVLHVAVTEEHLHIVDGLMERITEEDLELMSDYGFTALAAAIEVGNLPIAKCLIRKNKRLTSIDHYAYGIPVVHAVVSGQKHMVPFLYSVTLTDDLILPHNGRRAASSISLCILAQHIGMASSLLERAPFLAIMDNVPGRSPLFALAHSKVFPSTCSLTFWQRWIYNRIHIYDSTTNHVRLDIENTENSQKDINHSIYYTNKVLLGPLRWVWLHLLKLLDIESIYKIKLLHVQSLELLRRMCQVIESTTDEAKLEKAGVHDALMEAVNAGNVEFITSIVNANPDFVWSRFIARRVFEAAVECRQAKIFSLIYGLREKEAIVSSYDENRNNLLHKAAAVAPSRLLKLIPGAALQIQRELQWFKEVDAVASPEAREWTNIDNIKPRALFTENHKDLVVEGEKWMKDTSNSCSLVGAFIVTITFAAAFTFPGGNDQNNGFPMFLGAKLFRVFMTSNVVALFTSTTSVLMFLGILTSRYGDEDFLKSLPKKLIIGLSTLFLSIAAMIIAFCAGLFLMFHRQLWIVVPSICLAFIPVAFFVLMQFPLLVDIFMSTYGPSIFDRKVKRWVGVSSLSYVSSCTMRINVP